MQSSYARFIIDALSNACPKSAYFRMYIEKSEPHSDYEALAERANVESMEPDGILWRKLSWLWRMWHIGRDMELGDVDLYHGLAGLVPFGLARRNIRSVVTVHSLEFLRLRRLFSPLYNFYRRVIMLSSMRRADRIIAASECVKNDLVRYLHIDVDKIDVIYGGCHRRFSEPVTETEMARVRERYNLPNRYLLVAGRHNARKNLNHIIETLPQMDGDYLERDTTLRGELYRTLLPKLTSENADERRLASRALRIGLAAIDGRSVFGADERDGGEV